MPYSRHPEFRPSPHPLLGTRHRSAAPGDEIEFSAPLHGDTSRHLANLRLNGTFLLPSLAPLEIAFAVGQALSGHRQLVVEDVSFAGVAGPSLVGGFLELANIVTDSTTA